MSLLHPTPGEVMDRISILALKIIAHEQAGHDVSKLLSESRELHVYMESFLVPMNFDKYSKLQDRLAGINQELWEAEDQVRSKLPHKELAKVAKQIARLNDARSITIRKINKAFRTETIEEKIYG